MNLGYYLEKVPKVLILWLLVFAIAGFILWVGIGIYANFAEDDSTSMLPDFPDIKKAPNMFKLKATGNVFLANEYEHPTDEIYILNGYWEIRDGKYRFVDTDLRLDEKYFGDIILTRRTE